MSDAASNMNMETIKPRFRDSLLYYRLFGLFVICVALFSVYISRRSDVLVGDSMIGVIMLMFLLTYTAPEKPRRELTFLFLCFWILLGFARICI